LNSGGHLRTFYIQKSIAKAFENELVVPVRHDEWDHVESLRKEGIQVVPVTVPERSAVTETVRFAKSWARGLPYTLYGRHFHRNVSDILREKMFSDTPTLLWQDHLDSFQYCCNPSRARSKSIVDLHNVYSLIARRIADEETNVFKRFVLRQEARLLSCIEKSACKFADRIITVSEQEAEYFRRLGANDPWVAPNGADCSRFDRLPLDRSDKPLILLFLGTMNWGPNVDAARRLANDIFPKIRELRPDAELLLVGKDPCQEVLEFRERAGIKVMANVPDVKPFLSSATLMIVPLESGGGTRLKILEAMASGLPVVSTEIGAEGLEVIHNQHIWISRIEDMAVEVIRLAKLGEKRLAIAASARELVQNRYDWQAIGASCVRAIQQTLTEKIA
jgi:polysaccharide biosynthesis protein PslH